MYFLYVTRDASAIDQLEEVLNLVDKKKILLGVPGGYELIHFLQSIGEGEAYPEVIILTLQMPRLSGRDTLELLKTDDIYRLIPVFVFSTEELSNDETFCTHLGAELISTPSRQAEWVTAAKKICAACT
jgi:CheY-like chemotaxis protein